MGNESEFFGLAAKIRSWTHPLSKRHPWLKYCLAIVSIGVFFTLMRLAKDWQWLVLIGWFLAGVVWFQIFSRWRDSWWSRRRGRNIFTAVSWSLISIALILVGAFAWPLWMAFGEDQFD